MSEYMEFSGKTVDEALTEACVRLGIPSDEVDYEVIEKGSTGFLGIGNKPALIRARKKEVVPEEPVEVKAVEPVQEEIVKPEPVKEEVKVETNNVSISDSAKNFLNSVFQAMDMEVNIDVKYEKEEELLDIELSGKEMGVLIGKRGQTLDALQYLTKLAVNNHKDNKIKVKIDTEDYRNRRKRTLENLANNMALKVKRTGRPAELEPMNPFERRIIHSTLQNNRYVTTHSEGEEPDRYVVVTPK
ncbi:MAG: protein jag [Lachnospiraceae bacterium]|nr:protein jag [Lachnospiraceae bacterium]